MLDWLFQACLESALVSTLGIFLGLTLGAPGEHHAASLDLETFVKGCVQDRADYHRCCMAS